jgi:hypothetical protein
LRLQSSGGSVYLDSSGNLGIGVTPESFAKLQVKTATDRNISVFDNANGATICAINDLGGSVTTRIAGSPIVMTGGGGSGSEHMRIDSDGNLCLGVTDEIQNFGDGRTTLAIKGEGSADYAVINLANYGTTGASQIHGLLNFYDNTTAMARIASLRGTASTKSEMVFYTTDDSGSGITEAMRIDSSGNLLVGKTSTSLVDTGIQLIPNGSSGFTRDSERVLFLNRETNTGSILEFRKDNAQVGSIGTQAGDLYIANAVDVGLYFESSGTDHIAPCDQNGAKRDNAIDLGESGTRFDDVYATNGTIQTSDRNEKQDIEELSEAEQRVAVAAKALLRKFRWINSVEEKGDDARIHFGIIAQDLQAAFEAEGLDAGRYAMFISSTWWETYTDVPAVEAVEAQDAVYDEEGNLVSEAVEAVEAKEAYTRTDTYDTEEEAPEGAVKKSRMGVRYSELLAFIIAAI